MSGFPNHLIDPKKKDYDWVLNAVKWCWYEYRQNVPGKMFYHARDTYNKIRSYGIAKQGVMKYQTRMQDIDNGKDETWMNLDYTPLGILSKFRRTILGKLNKVDYDMDATAIDALARDQVDQKFADDKAKIIMRESAQQINPELTDSPSLRKNRGEAEDLEELEIRTSNGNAKHQVAIEAELGTLLVFTQNNCEELRKLVRKDIVDWNVGGYKEYLENGAVKIDKVDPRAIVTSYCERPDFKDSLFIGEVKDITIGQLKQSAGKQFNPEQYEKIARQMQRRWGNPRTSPGNGKQIDDMRIRVVDIEIKSVNDIYYEERTNKYGNKVSGKTTYGAESDESRTVSKVSAIVIYRAKWVIDTDMMWDWGLATDMKRVQSSLTDTDYSYHLYCGDLHDMETTSVMELGIPIIDRIMMAWLKLQNVINMARPKGIQIEMGSLEDVPLGKNGKKFTPLQVIDLFEKKGILVYRKQDDQGRMTNYKPIEELENGLGRDAMTYYAIIDRDIQLLRDVSGFNELTDASTPDERTLTTVAQLANEGTNNALAQIREADRYLLEDLAKSVVIRLQDAVRDGNIEGYARGLGETGVKFIQVTPRLALHEIGIMLRDRPKDEQKQRMFAQLQFFEGQGLLEPDDFFLVENTNDVKQAEQIITYRVKKRKQEKRQIEVQNQQMTFQGQQQSVVVGEQAKQQSLSVEYHLKKDFEIALKEKDKEILDLKMKWEYEIEKLRTTGVVHKTQVQADSNEKIQKAKQGIEAPQSEPLFDENLFNGLDSVNQNEQQQS